MTELAYTDSRALIVRRKMDEAWKARDVSLTLEMPGECELAPTIFIARRYGGTGASTLAAILELLLQQDVLIIEVGGNTCPAFKARSSELHAHFPSNDDGRIHHAMDLRFANASRVVIIEFEPSLYKETLQVADRLSLRNNGVGPMLFYLLGPHETDPPYAKNAVGKGLEEPFVYRQARQRVFSDEDRAATLPWLDPSITRASWTGNLGLEQAIAQCPGTWTLQDTRLNLENFANSVLRR